jgi:predicted nucleic acid-binding protein
VKLLVADASALAGFLLRTPRARVLDPVLTDPETDLHVPALTDLEVVSVLRQAARREPASIPRLEQALGHDLDLPLTRHGHKPFVTGKAGKRANPAETDPPDIRKGSQTPRAKLRSLKSSWASLALALTSS